MKWWMVIASGWLIVDCNGAPPPTPDAAIPARPADGVSADRSTLETFAIDSIFLGDVDRSGNGYAPPSGLQSCGASQSPPPPTTFPWKSFGFDLDGKITTTSSTDVCALVEGAPRTDQVDGTNGIDNAWGSTLMPIAETAANSPTPPSTYESQQIQSGAWTLQLQLRGLPVVAAPTVGIAAQIFVSGAFGDSAPSFDSTTDWPVLASSTVDDATVAGGALVSYDDAYVADDGTFVSGTPSESPLVVPFVVSGTPIVLRVHHAVVTFQRSDAAHLASGTIAGVLETNELVATIRFAAGVISTSLCGDAFDGVAQQIEQAQDILSDGTNAPQVPCDAISIGLGFTARLVGNPTQVVADPPPPPNPCTPADAGAD